VHDLFAWIVEIPVKHTDAIPQTDGGWKPVPRLLHFFAFFALARVPPRPVGKELDVGLRFLGLKGADT